MTAPYSHHAVRELAWAFEGPGLLAHDVFHSNVESDATMRQWVERHRARINALEQDPTPLLRYLSGVAIYDRLGRYFEALLRYFLVEVEGVSKLLTNLQVREKKATIGELDLVFLSASLASVRARHWEASVKFYLCTALDEDEAREERFFMGTLVEDRLDRKLHKLLEKQLKLPLLPAAHALLSEAGLASPESRALLKGFLYYASDKDWKTYPHPSTISVNHVHGWWTTSDKLCLPRESSQSRYILLEPARWLAPYYGWIPCNNVLTRESLSDLVREVFSGPTTERSVFREMMVAEVEPEAEADGTLRVRELSRGNILHAEWPKLARTASEPDEGLTRFLTALRISEDHSTSRTEPN